jgi:hypothetical protein
MKVLLPHCASVWCQRSHIVCELPISHILGRISLRGMVSLLCLPFRSFPSLPERIVLQAR